MVEKEPAPEADLTEFVRDLLGRELIVPVRSSEGRELEAIRVPIDELRHGRDERGPFLAAYTDPALFETYGPPRSDWIRLPARELASRADGAAERVILDPGAPGERELPGEALTALAAGAVPGGLVRRTIASAEEPRSYGTAARPAPPPVTRPGQPLPELAPPGEIPSAFGEALSVALEDLPQVARAWLLRRGEGWTIGIEQVRQAALADFDEVRNKLHAVATEQLGTRRLLAVTDLRAPSLRDHYASMAEPFFERRDRAGFLSRIFGR